MMIGLEPVSAGRTGFEWKHHIIVSSIWVTPYS